MILIISLVCAVICALLYRMGGSGDYSRQFRIVGCPAIVMAQWFAIAGFSLPAWWIYLLTFGLNAGAISAYWGQDEKKFGYFWHGLGLAIAALPLAYLTGHWLGFAMRSIAVSIGIALWSEYTSWDILEEHGRGFIVGITIPLLLI